MVSLLNLPQEKAGGLLNPLLDAAGLPKPTMVVDGLSRTLGPAAIGAATPDLEQILSGLNVNLLGGIKVSDVIRVVAGGSIGSQLRQIPAMITRQLPDRIETTLHWRPDLQTMNTETLPTEAPPLVPLIVNAQTVLTIDTTLVAPLNGSSPTFSVTGSLSSFGLNLLNVIVVTFDRLLFTVGSGRKPDISTSGVQVEFVGPLSFVNQLADVLPSNGFSDGPSLQVTPQGITAGYSLAVPAVGVGAFSLENIALSAAMTLPFADKPVGLRLAFSERFHPFLVTLSLVGGGGFLSIGLSTRGIDTIEGSLELGGNITVSLLVVEANVHALIGFYFSIKQADNQSGLTMDFLAYIRVGASINLLGIVGVSVDIYLGLGFTPNFLMSPKPTGILGTVSGTVSVTVGVHLLFIDKSFQLTFSRSFNIPSRVGVFSLPVLADPSFDEMISPAEWQEYCQAFA